MNKYLQSVLILLGATSYYWYKYLYAYAIFGAEQYNAVDANTRRWLIRISVLGTCILITAILTSFNIKKAMHLLGLDKNIVPALIAAIVCCIPMFAGGALYSAPNDHITASDIFNKAIWAGFNEELIFRGFIVGLLVRSAGWHIVPAIILSAVLFAWGHLYQADSPTQAVLVFFVVSGAGIGFAVFYKMWGWNLWFPLFMHILMNLSFVIYNMGDTVLLNKTANITRGITILLAILATIYVSYSARGKAK